jgi:hypothetical protein
LLACSRIMASKTGLNTVNNSIKCGAVAADGSRAFGRVTILISSISVMSLSGARPSRHQSACEFVEENQQSKRQHRERYEILSLLLGNRTSSWKAMIEICSFHFYTFLRTSHIRDRSNREFIYVWEQGRIQSSTEARF